MRMFANVTAACLVALVFSASWAFAAPMASLDYTAWNDPDGGTDASWEDVAGVGSGFDFALGAGVSYNGSPTGAPSGISAVYEFDGSSSATAKWSGTHMQAFPNDPTNNDASFEIVFRANTINQQAMLWDFGGSGDGASMSLNNGTLQFVAKDGGVSSGIAQSIAANAFIHVVGVIDLTGDQLRLYVNGSEVTGSPVTYTGNDWAGNDGGNDGALGSKHGNTHGGTGGFFGTINYGNLNGDIALFRMYEASLTQADAEELFSVIPEPASIGLLAIGALCLVRRSK